MLSRYAKDEAEHRRLRALDALPLGILQDREAEVQAKQLLEAAEIDLEAARRNLKRCKITSPIDGYVDMISIISGSTITLDTPVTLIRKLDPVHVRMDFPQERIDDVRIGQPADVVLDSLPQETFAGTVIRIFVPRQHTDSGPPRGDPGRESGPPHQGGDQCLRAAPRQEEGGRRSLPGGHPAGEQGDDLSC